MKIPKGEYSKVYEKLNKDGRIHRNIKRYVDRLTCDFSDHDVNFFTELKEYDYDSCTKRTTLEIVDYTTGYGASDSVIHTLALFREGKLENKIKKEGIVTLGDLAKLEGKTWRNYIWPDENEYYLKKDKLIN